MDLGIKDKVVIITGGSKGIGEAITRQVAEEGAIPVIVSRSKETAERLQKELKSSGKESYFVEAELSIKENCKYVIDETLKKYNRIDALINNAGIIINCTGKQKSFNNQSIYPVCQPGSVFS